MSLLPRAKPIKDDTPPRLRRAQPIVEGVSLFEESDGHPDAFRSLEARADYLGDEFPAVFEDWRARHDEAQSRARGRARHELAAVVTPVDKPPPLAPVVASPPPVTPKPRVRAVTLS